jgi:16S rRNA (adenine1518-N6/adenine1519-N6)-dimethyltransferase
MPEPGRAPDWPALREVIAAFDLKADKSLGQHFLLDGNLIDKIRRCAEPLAGLNVIEIGPGPGGLTRALLNSAALAVTAVEIDPRAVAAIRALAASRPDRLAVIAGDALKLDLPQLVAAPRAIVANLPYNVGTPLLLRWLAQAAEFRAMTLMFQLEVAERIVARPGTGAYGRLSVISQWVCDTAIMMQVPASAFTPPPKIESAIVRLVPKAEQPAPELFKAMERLTAAAFGQRRKMLRGALRGLGGEALLEAAGIAPERRAETLSVAEFENLLLVGGFAPKPRAGDAVPCTPAKG